MKHTGLMARAISLFILCLSTLSTHAVVSVGDYYICNDFFGKMLADSTGTGSPVLRAYDAEKDDIFIFTAEASGTDGYVKLKNKATGKYLAASSSDNYTVLMSADGTGDRFLWKLDQRYSTTIVNKKSSSKRLGCDFYQGSKYFMHQTYVPVYYDKSAGALNWFTIIAANGSGYDASLLESQSDTTFVNEYGVLEKDDYQVKGTVVVTDTLDYHIIGSSPFAAASTINLKTKEAFLVFENIRPSVVKSSYLSKVKINGKTASDGSNCRVEIWLHGAVVIPKATYAMTCTKVDGKTFNLSCSNHSNLGTNSNMMTSFVLKRGYMATLATDKEGEGYSRVYVADHGDLTVTLPTPLTERVSSVNIREWHYTSKSGYCSTSGSVVSEAPTYGGSWCWNWDASQSTSDDVEYIPIKQHLYWPSDANCNKQTSTAVMLYNEPEHSEQHDNCDCGGTISAWTAYTHTGNFNASGMRIGSPSATDLSYIKSYLQYCDNMKQRCDFSCTHGYWSTEWASNLSTLKGYGRPIWITEWEYGASWTSGTDPSSQDDAAAKVFDILEKLEYNDYVERYSYYRFDTGTTNGWMRDPAKNWTLKQVLNKVKPHLGYKASIQPVPNWWAPTAYAPYVTAAKLSDGKYTLTIQNDNGDCTGSLIVYCKLHDGGLLTAEITNRSLFESTTQTVELPEVVQEGDTIEVIATTLYDTKQLTKGIYVLPGSHLKNLTFDQGEMLDKSVLTYAKDITDATAQTSGLQPVEGWVCNSKDATAGGQFAVSSNYYLGKATFLPATTNSTGDATGGMLGILGCWTSQPQYTQSVILPAGSYKITIPVYNAGGTNAITKNLIGFITDGGDEHLATTTKYPVGEWTTETIEFTLKEAQTGSLTLGYTADNVGSDKMPHLFIDYVQVLLNGEEWEKATPVAPVLSTTASTTPLRYNLAGQLATKHSKGIIIQNGKKVIR